MNPSVYLIATGLALIPLLILYKITIERIKEDPTVAEKAQRHFFIGAALSEVIPLILIVYAFTNTEKVTTITALYTPAIVLALATGAASFFIILQRFVDVQTEAKPVIDSFVSISFALILSVPMISAVGLFLMIP